jgi:hypothetical protein
LKIFFIHGVVILWLTFFSILDSGQHVQVGLVSGGVSPRCGDKNIPSYFARLDHPEIASFITDPENKSGKGSVNPKPAFLNRLVTKNFERIKGFKTIVQDGYFKTINLI